MHRSARQVRVVAFLVAGAVALSMAWPAWRSLSPPGRFPVDLDVRTQAEVIRGAALEAVTGLWFLMVGAALGSFLNVVVYRMPRRESVIWRPSYCPRCHSQIRLSDNLPMWGWVRLRGRCRDCWLPISMRYPLVELAFGLMFFVLAQVELLSGGTNLPMRVPHRHRGALYVLWDPDWPLIGIFGFHSLMLFLLMGWALMAWDRQRPPWYYVAFAIAVGSLLPLAGLFLHPLPGVDPDRLIWPKLAPSAALLATSVLGLAAGGLLGAIASVASSSTGSREPRAAEPRDPGTVGAAVALGGFLGWQAALCTALFATIYQCLARFVGMGLASAPGGFMDSLRRTPWATALAPAAFFLLLDWRVLFLAGLMPYDRFSYMPLALLAMFVALCLVARRLGRTPPEPGAPLPPNDPSQGPAGDHESNLPLGNSGAEEVVPHDAPAGEVSNFDSTGQPRQEFD